MEFLTHTFVAPSGTEYTIREQNGQDEEVLTNMGEIKKGMNINNFLYGIIMKSSKKASKLSMEEILSIPLLDRSCILIQSRIFSIGENLEFTFQWPNNQNPDKPREFEYELNLHEYLFDDYSNPEAITEEMLLDKPKGIPFYPIRQEEKYYTFDLRSGKKIRFHLADGHSEMYIMKLSEDQKTRNTDLIMRGLELNVDGKWEKVFNFSLFSTKDMRELRKHVNSIDPSADLTTYVEDPETGASDEIPIMGLVSFFFPEEDV